MTDDADRSVSEVKVFISHSEDDDAYFLTLRLALEYANINIWDRSEIGPGRSLADQLRDAIHECQICVFLATPKSIVSGWCAAELGAFWGAGKQVIVFLGDCDLAESDLQPQFQGMFKATKPQQLIDEILGERFTAATRAACEKINSREDVYKKCRELIKSATTIRDTTWGKKAPQLTVAENESRTLYRQAIDRFVSEGKDYRELVSSDTAGGSNFLLEAKKKKEIYPNYLCRVLSTDISQFPMVEVMIADNNKVLFSYPASDNRNYAQYVYAESETLAGLFIQYWSDIWANSNDRFEAKN